MIIAIVTTYKPDAALRARFEPLLEVCGAVVFVDNTPGGASSFDVVPGFHVVRNMQNLGLGRALNEGIAEARRLNASEIILFDQDSTPSAVLVSTMVAALRKVCREMGPRVGVGPTHVDDQTGNLQSTSKWRKAQTMGTFETVTCLPTSGITFSARALADDERFSADFFLDLADFEWCWRLRTRGWKFVRDHDIVMPHRLGLGERTWMGLKLHIPAPYRHYFQFRDTLRLLPLSYVPLYSKVRLTTLLPLKLLVYPFILDGGLERLIWMGRGIRDACRGVKGIGAAAARLN